MMLLNIAINEAHVECYSKNNTNTISFASSRNDVDYIISTLSEKEKSIMCIENGVRYLPTKEKENELVYRCVYKYRGIPVAFFDLLDDGKYGLNAVVAAVNDERYRNKGFASKCVEKGIDWYNKNRHKLNNKRIIWWAAKKNKPSQRVAEKNGFIIDKTIDPKYKDLWYKYIY